MAYKIIIQPQAEADVEFIYGYVAAFSLISARKWRMGVFSSIASLSVMPNRYSLILESEDFEYEIRHLLYGRNTSCYRIIYHVVEEDKEVRILTIRHASRQPLDIEDLE
ncbi:MAG: type II toxin-antitoxin system RelE/ParE family toxin [Rickettsiales bacterium]